MELCFEFISRVEKEDYLSQHQEASESGMVTCTCAYVYRRGFFNPVLSFSLTPLPLAMGLLHPVPLYFTLRGVCLFPPLRFLPSVCQWHLSRHSSLFSFPLPTDCQLWRVFLLGYHPTCTQPFFICRI